MVYAARSNAVERLARLWPQRPCPTRRAASLKRGHLRVLGVRCLLGTGWRCRNPCWASAIILSPRQMDFRSVVPHGSSGITSTAAQTAPAPGLETGWREAMQYDWQRWTVATQVESVMSGVSIRPVRSRPVGGRQLVIR